MSRTVPVRWVSLNTVRGVVITRPDAVAQITAWNYDPLPFSETGVEIVMHNAQHHIVLPEPGESRGDALARVCGLLGIEVTR